MADQDTAKPQFQRDDDFTSLYANHVWYSLTIWDLKLVFGQLDEIEDSKVVEQHTAITLPWLQAKLMTYFMQVNVAIYEHENGPIKIPPSVVPRVPKEEEVGSKEMVDKILELQKRFIEGR